MFALPPDDVQLPAVPEKSVCSADPLPGSALNAKSMMLPGTVCGRATAQMIAPGSLPSEETAVKNPGSCPPGKPGEDPAFVNLIGRDVGTFQTVTALPPLATMRGSESLAASKYD